MGMSFGFNRDFGGGRGPAASGPLPGLGRRRRDGPPRLRRHRVLDRHSPHRRDRQGDRHVQAARLAHQLAGAGHAPSRRRCTSAPAPRSSRARGPIMIWPMLPRTFTEGDTVRVFGTVHNLTEQGAVGPRPPEGRERRRCMTRRRADGEGAGEGQRAGVLDVPGRQAGLHRPADVGEVRRGQRRVAEEAAGHGRGDHRARHRVRARRQGRSEAHAAGGLRPGAGHGRGHRRPDAGGRPRRHAAVPGRVPLRLRRADDEPVPAGDPRRADPASSPASARTRSWKRSCRRWWRPGRSG